ncbi:MAG: HD domain-containing protein [Proteobacteria bacterium]|nr:HD domain-containing protein [Pseudomonadota bacterium]MBU1641242.1 HD domain-containing protein [Pseudomonadota bacterium]
MTKKNFISDITDGQQVEDLFMVQELSKLETKAGKPYLSLKLMDKSGEMVAKVWERADELERHCPAGAVVAIKGRCSSYRNTLQLSITDLARVPNEDVDFSAFVPTSRYDVDKMAAEFVGLAKSVSDPFIKKLLLKFFDDEDFFAVFKKAPAAKAMHHAYLGGLLEHTLGVARLADSVSKLYPSLDRSLLMAGAMLHDIGKIKEFSFDSHTFDYSDSGRLVGHMVLGVEMIQERVSKIKDFPEELAVRVKHLLLSHHGRHDFGSPTLPMLLEGFALNFIDDLDAKINTIEKVSAQAKEEGYQWSDYQRSLERFLFVKGHSAQAEEDTEENTPPLATPPRKQQPSLF